MPVLHIGRRALGFLVSEASRRRRRLVAPRRLRLAFLVVREARTCSHHCLPVCPVTKMPPSVLLGTLAPRVVTLAATAREASVRRHPVNTAPEVRAATQRLRVRMVVSRPLRARPPPRAQFQARTALRASSRHALPPAPQQGRAAAQPVMSFVLPASQRSVSRERRTAPLGFAHQNRVRWRGLQGLPPVPVGHHTRPAAARDACPCPAPP